MSLYPDAQDPRERDGEFANPDADIFTSECSGCGSPKCCCRESIIGYMQVTGWKADGEGFQKDWEQRVDLSGDSGYLWSLQEFTDGDIDGVATGRWRDMDIEGDTLADLKGALNQLVIEQSERESDARAAITRSWPTGGEHVTGSAADDWCDRSGDL